jgi:hypothetical protein
MGLHVTVNLVIVECAKPNECNVWLMPEAVTMFPMMVVDHTANPK